MDKLPAMGRKKARRGEEKMTSVIVVASYGLGGATGGVIMQSVEEGDALKEKTKNITTTL